MRRGPITAIGTGTRSSGTAKKVEVTADGGVVTVSITRPEVRNAVDAETASALRAAFEAFDETDSLAVAVLTGAGGNFCAGYDLKALAAGAPNPLPRTGAAPLGPTPMMVSKPVIAAVEGYAVAGGLELALWCDLGVAAKKARLGVFNRRLGVPLIDLGTVRLPRIIGQGRALDLILTGRPVSAMEALQISLVDRLVEPGTALEEAQRLARQIADLPQGALPAARRPVLPHWALTLHAAAPGQPQSGPAVLPSPEPPHPP